MNASIEGAIRHRTVTKKLQTLVGIVTGIMSDGALNDSEVLYLRTWLSENRDMRSIWPASLVHARVEDVLADGRIDQVEREHLANVLTQVSADSFADTGSTSAEPTAVPINDCVTIILKDSRVCLTGTFYWGTRAACERATLKAGAMPCDNVTRKVDVLVVGSMITPSWTQESFGRKIIAATALQEAGHPIEIISEKRWIEAMALDEPRV